MEIAFPTSTQPAVNPTECGGRLINCYAEVAPEGSRGSVIFRRSAGNDFAFTAGSSTPRGAIKVGTVLYVVNGDKCYSVTKAGTAYTVTELSGTVGGEGRVLMAHNMRSPTPQILIWHSSGFEEIDGAAVVSFSDADLPSANSLCFMDGYFLVTSASGFAYASALNDTTFSELDYTRAEAQPDQLVRGIPYRRDYMLMGASTTEFWTNVGNATGFPFSRGAVIHYGLWGPYAVAGHDADFPGPLIWVANDNTVRLLNGYSPEKISTSHIERLITAQTNRTGLRASVHMAAGHANWVLKSDDWTLVYDISTGKWHERRTHKRDNWRMEFGVFAFDEWLVFDEGSGNVYRVNERSRREAGQVIPVDLISNQQHSFPARSRVNRASFDFATGVGVDQGIYPIETNPKVSISWSDDGGVTFKNSLVRDLGTQGEITKIDIWRAGFTGRLGRMWRVQQSDPVEFSMIGAAMFGE